MLMFCLSYLYEKIHGLKPNNLNNKLKLCQIKKEILLKPMEKVHLLW